MAVIILVLNLMSGTSITSGALLYHMLTPEVIEVLAYIIIDSQHKHSYFDNK